MSPNSNHNRKRVLVIDQGMFASSYADFVNAADIGEITLDVSAFLLNPDDFSLVHFTGGEDVHPSFYGETSPRNVCYSSIERDNFERKIYEIAVKHRVRCYGICRGAQFLNVMLGGKMVHHMAGHAGPNHTIQLSTDLVVPNTAIVTSTHHQMMIPSVGVKLIAWSTEKRSTVYIGDKDEPMEWPGPEVEGIFSSAFDVLGMQWHPEMMSPDTYGYRLSLSMLRDFAKLRGYEFVNKYCPNANDPFVLIRRT
jgi:gamma-glutamyl-gamma-aminobutyrate hydrolase PuuD